MKYYKDSNNQVYAYADDGSQDEYIPTDLIAITEAEADELRAPPPPTPDQLAAQFDAAINAVLFTFVQAGGWVSLDRVLAQTGAYAADAQQAQAGYDQIWEAAIPLIPQVTAGTLSVEDALAQLPELVWLESE
jgi:hypothetical protein